MEENFMKINWHEVAQSAGYKRLKKAVMDDCARESNCFNTMGCNNSKSTCFNKPCDAFKHIIDLAKNHSHYTGKSVGEILTEWESERTYWYVNYYNYISKLKSAAV